MPRIGERGWIHSGVKVYDNTAAPTSWTDLNLSSVTGKNRALVFLKIKNKHDNISTTYHFRPKGDTEDVAFEPTYAGGNSLVHVNAGKIVHIVMSTGSAGIVQWKETYGLLVDIDVLGYIR